MVLFLDEFSAWVTIDGQELQEYRPQHKPKKNLLACWIASVAGKNFQIHWRDSKRHTATDGHCRIDGNPCGGKVISCDADKPAFAIKSYMRTGPTTLKPFKFSDVQLTDDDTLADPEMRRNELGQIDLLIFRVGVKYEEPAITQIAPQQQILHEKAKKGIPHQMTFDETLEESQSRKAVRVQQLTEDTIARFRFCYRPLEILQAKGIAPPPKNESPSISAANGVQRDVKRDMKRDMKIKNDEPPTRPFNPKSEIPQSDARPDSSPDCKPSRLNTNVVGRRERSSLPKWKTPSPGSFTTERDVKKESDAAARSHTSNYKSEQANPKVNRIVSAPSRSQVGSGISAMDPIIVDEDLEMEVRHKPESITSIVATLRDPRIRATVAIPENGPTASFGTGTPWVHNRKRKRSLGAASPDSIPQHSQNKRRTALHKKEGVEGHNISVTSSACSDHVSMGGELNDAHEEDPVMAREMEALKAEYEAKIQALQVQRVKKQQTRQLAGSNTGRNAESGQGLE